MPLSVKSVFNAGSQITDAVLNTFRLEIRQNFALINNKVLLQILKILN